MSSAGRATIATIAREAGVSIPTVSRVLSGRADVVAATRSRVEALLSEHGYRRRGRSGTVAAPVIDLVSHELDGAWAVEVIKGVTRAAMDLARVPIDPSLIHKRGGPRAGPVHPRPAELGRLRRSRGVAVGGPAADHDPPAGGRDGRGMAARMVVTMSRGAEPVTRRYDPGTSQVVRQSTAPPPTR